MKEENTMMNMHNTSRRGWNGLALAAGLALLMAGCSSVPLGGDEVPVESRTPTALNGGAGGAGGAGSGGAAQSQVAPVDLTKNNGDADANRAKIVYFDYDSFVVKDEYRPMIVSYARALDADRSMHVVVAGHTDERGGSEYNLALGQKRAEAVTKALALLGADASQLEAVSFGKERPAVQGHDESAWAKNRRAEIHSR
ncbi:MAG TPA: peptidoglycan-associated lipoprotein Pal [Burkholderiaceae bacterium]|nr:peptidoglycan-associated lipoprotein Pal [Burkholderiaceae bacterium]